MYFFTNPGGPNGKTQEFKSGTSFCVPKSKRGSNIAKGKDRNHTIQFHWNKFYTRKSTNGSKFCFLFQAFL
ncbi:hypothetical protein LEP1GSC039_0380 [Leptospira santarosai str. 2000027870]|nr:hypothetical protein LEP1GSC039_0380 [Leptospira santarosai str. 2000027870]